LFNKKKKKISAFFLSCSTFSFSDPAAQRFGLVFFTVLAFATIGAAVGIGVGNISHYRSLNRVQFNI